MSNGGILKNKNELNPEKHQYVEQTTKEFREQVLKNTKLNSQLKPDGPREPINPSTPSSDSTAKQFLDPANNTALVTAYNELSEQDKESLKWDINNLNSNSVIQKKIIENMKSQGQSIDEPKTPFQAAKEMNEYYNLDEDEDLNGFSLGEPEMEMNAKQDEFSLNDTELIRDDDKQEESKHKKSFEEMRKQHYHHEHLPAPQNIEEVEDEEEDDDEDEDEDLTPKPKMSFAEMRKMHYHNERVIPNNQDEDDDDDE
ncbi:hypothetical protein WICPIJ_005278 [Wickerhamomyces pijperi]|uniref:Protein GLC8 n=1 Tax=Wickerhamomyces pijperi TaxID=599730 RepID=A0A9P8Q6L0_WICPI|nr:hypothetical protein WICPIJ_005278 [Wickerhamomyces pijperi]